jgi:polyisoprenoid-binding protein YceI
MRARAKRCGLTLAVALVVSGALPVLSARRIATLRLDPANTHINFTLKGFPHDTEGSFKLKSGEIRVDPDTGKTEGSVIIDAASGTTGIGMRDSNMRQGVLETQRYPEISFSPHRAEGRPVPNGDFTVTVNGLMSLHGDQHDMTLTLAIHRSADDFTAATHFTVPYVRWGLKNPSVLFLTASDEVIVEVDAAGHVTWAPAP